MNKDRISEKAFALYIDGSINEKLKTSMQGKNLV
jgi:hypothetical protein